MKIQLTSFASNVQTLLTQTIFTLASLCRFFPRRRNYSLDQFVHTLMFGWIEKPHATLESFAARLGVAPQSLAARLDKHAVQFAEKLLEAHLNLMFAADEQRQRLLDRFSAVIVEDSTTVQLPADAADDWPGCGNHCKSGQAAVKLNLRYELKTGCLLSLTRHAGKDADAPLAAKAEELPENSLHLADLGYFDTGRWNQMQDRYFISRANAQVQVLKEQPGEQGEDLWESLADFLKRQPARARKIDVRVVINKTNKLSVRLVALRCPEEVANRRKQKAYKTALRKGRSVSEAQLVLCEWTVLLTNVPREKLSAQEVWILYRCRWQAELWFKRGKQFGGWEQTTGRSQHRVLVELWLKLVGTLLMMWAVLLGGGPLVARSIWKRMHQAKHYMNRLGVKLMETGEISVEVLEEMLRTFDNIRERTQRKTKPASLDLLNEPKLTETEKP